MITCVLTYAQEWLMLTFMIPSFTVSSALFMTSIRDNKFGLPESCCRSHWHKSVFPGYRLSCFFLSLTHFYPLVVVVEVYLIIFSDTHTLGRTLLDTGCARRRVPYITAHNTHHSKATDINAPCEIRNRNSRPQTHDLNHAAGCPFGHKILCRLQVVQINLLLKEHPSNSQMANVLFRCWNPQRSSASMINNAKQNSVFHVLWQAVLSLPRSTGMKASLHFYYSSNQR